MPFAAKTRRFLPVAVLSVCTALGLWLAGPPIAHQLAMRIVEAKRAAVGKAAPDFTLEDASAAHVSLSDFHGKVIVLNFWATWCGPCGIEIPWFVQFQNKYGPRGFTVLGVSMDDNTDPEVWATVKRFRAERKMNYPVLRGNDDVSDLYGGVESLPTTLLIRRDGRVAYWHRGLIDKAQYEKEILELLQ
ncbi:MAG TPA: TlpA disulfide reductase family protein [Bryobacteraceae bacterium]|nr:TlpA disulfide reductase family protein [Bryobacteraceae bacterium]